ncbi:MAG: cell division protein FtsA, partial [Syntrophomonadaceae bacterium]|nr:cell division protein FtsA [Syntrophomonadaceae bacterium]
MARRHLVVSLDIGTTKTVALVGEVEDYSRINLIGVGQAPSQGLRRGVIVNIGEAAGAIDLALEKAERMSGVQITGALVGMTGAGITSINSRGVIAVFGEDREITDEDVQRAVNNSRFVTIPAGSSILHVIPRQFVVDGCGGIRDPAGMMGARLEVESHIISVATTSVQNVVKSVKRAGLKLQGLVLSPLAACEAVLHPGERDLGVVLVDIGGGTTSITLYEGGSPWFTSVLPVGGDHITSDLAVGLRTGLVEAEKVKIEHGCLMAGLAYDREAGEVPGAGGSGSQRVSRRQLAGIIEPRVQEILSLVQSEISRSGYRGVLPGGVVLTGGTASLKGISEFAQAELGLPVRIGLPTRLGGLFDVAGTPAYASGIGLLLKAARNYHEEMVRRD